MNKIKVLMADNSTIFGVGLATVLSGDKRIEVINHDSHSTQDVVDKVEKLAPDIVLIDSQLAGYDVVRLTEMLQELAAEVKVIILTPPDDTDALLDGAIRAGAKGFLIKTVSPMGLINSVIETAHGGAAISPRLMPLILRKLAARREKPVVGLVLSAREKEVMELVAEGKGNRDIAGALFISENTVKGHLRSVIDKLNVNNRVEVARYVLLQRLAQHEESPHR